MNRSTPPRSSNTPLAMSAPSVSVRGNLLRRDSTTPAREPAPSRQHHSGDGDDRAEDDHGEQEVVVHEQLTLREERRIWRGRPQGISAFDEDPDRGGAATHHDAEQTAENAPHRVAPSAEPRARGDWRLTHVLRAASTASFAFWTKRCAPPIARGTSKRRSKLPRFSAASRASSSADSARRRAELSLSSSPWSTSRPSIPGSP